MAKNVDELLTATPNGEGMMKIVLKSLCGRTLAVSTTSKHGQLIGILKLAENDGCGLITKKKPRSYISVERSAK